MDKKVSIKSIDKIIKSNSFEKKEIVYKCDDEDVVIEVTPGANYGDWYTAIEASMSVIFGGESGYTPSLVSAAYGLALVSCFTNLKTDNVTKLIDLIRFTDIASRVEEALPASVLSNFRSDFESAKNYRESQEYPLGKMVGYIGFFKAMIESFGEMSEEDLQKLEEKINAENDTAI